MGPTTEPGAGLATELEAGLATEPVAGPTTELRVGPADTKKSLVLIAFITIINISTSRLHNMIKTYSDKKQANHYGKPPQIPTTAYHSANTNGDHWVLYAQALKALLLSALSTKAIY